MILAPTNRRIIRSYEKPSFEHTQRYGLVKGHWANERRELFLVLNEGSGRQVLDLSERRNHSTLEGTSPSWRSGKKYGPAVVFPGTDERIVLGKSINLSGSKTICFWFYWTQLVTDTGDMFCGGASNRFYPYITKNSIIIRSFSGQTSQSGHSYATYTEHFLAISGNGTTATFYQNGEVLGTGTDRTPIVTAICSDTAVWQPFNGVMHVVMIYDRALPVSELDQLYRKPFLGIEKRTAPVYFFVPTGAIDETVEPATQALALQQHAPVIIAGIVVEPVTQALALEQHAPGVSIDVTVTPATQALALQQHAPVIIAGIVVEPVTQALALEQHAPDVSIDATVAPSTQALALTQHAPTVTAGLIITPSTLELAATLHAPGVQIDFTGIMGYDFPLELTLEVPTLEIGATVTPSTQALALTLHAPVIDTGPMAIVVYPDTLALEGTLLAPDAITFWAEIPPFMEKDLVDPYSGGAWLWLCQIVMAGQATTRIARNTADVRYAGEDFQKFNLQIGEQVFTGDGSIPRVTLRVAQDVNRIIEEIVNATEGALGAQVKLIRVNEKFLTAQVSALEADYYNLAAESDTEWVTFTLGVPNPLKQRIPLRNYSCSMCPWREPALFKGPRCQYAGPDPTCTGTYADCYAKGNAEHWGADLGLDPSVVQV